MLEPGVRLALAPVRRIAQVARDLGVEPEVLRKRVRQAEADQSAARTLPMQMDRRIENS
jgi:transposase-like protein